MTTRAVRLKLFKRRRALEPATLTLATISGFTEKRGKPAICEVLGHAALGTDARSCAWMGSFPIQRFHREKHPRLWRTTNMA